jgi:HTH-type transcriptional regulator/antitoxin HigA
MLDRLVNEKRIASYIPVWDNPVEAIKFRMERAGLTPKDLEPMIGRTNRVFEVLPRKRPLTLPMIRRLHAALGIPAESLISESVRA